MGLVRRFLLRRIPAYVDGGLNIVDVRDVATGPSARRREGRGRASATSSAAATSPCSASSPTSRGSPASQPPPLKLPAAARDRRREVGEQARAAAAVAADEARSAALWWTYSPTKAKRELGFSPRPHEETLEDAVRWQMRRARRSHRSASEPGCAERARTLAGSGVRAAERLPRRDERASCSTAARRRPTSSVPAGRSRGGCESSDLEHRVERVPYAALGAGPRSRS